MGWLNIGSLLFGLLAWSLPLIFFASSGKEKKGRGPILLFLSLGFCAASLCMQIFYGKHLVDIQDWSALLDTSGAVLTASIILLLGTLLLNGVAVAIQLEQQKKGE